MADRVTQGVAREHGYGQAMTAWAAHLPAGMVVEDVDLLARGSLARSWCTRWADDPARRAVYDDDQGWLTAGDLEERSRRVAGRLAASGLSPGDRVLISAEASMPLVVAFVACVRSGLAVVPANTAYRERELGHVVRDALPAAAIVDDAERGRWAKDAAAEADRPLTVLGTEVDGPAGPAPPWLDQASADDTALVIYTSGTTGTPKGAVLTHANLLASAEAVALAWRWSAEDRLVLALPLFHLHGLGVALCGTLTAGGSVVLRRRFRVGDVADSIDRHQATLFFGVPTMWSRLASAGRLGDLARLRLGVSGSAPMPASLHEAIATGSGQRIIERYGMTETVMNVSNPYEGERRAGTVGFPLPGVEIRLAEGTAEIMVQGPNVFAGYWGRPDATTDAFVDGWFASGDVGAIDADGYLRIVGRHKELIITGGYNVYPREVEDVLRTHPAVDDVAVVGAADPDWGEVVVAVVEGPGERRDTEAVLAHAAEGLAAYKRPKRVVFVDALPRNAMGKVVRSEVQDLLG